MSNGIARRVGVILVTAVLAAAAVPVHAATAAACPDDSGHERLTLHGFGLEVEGPLPAGVPSALHTGTDWLHLPMQADLAPSSAARVEFEVGWLGFEDDFDAYVQRYDGAQWQLLDSSNRNNPERVVVTISHCDVVMLSVQNVGGGIDTDLGITAALESVGASLACAADDPAPGCAGKAAGAAPDLAADRRSILYLGPQLPGQIASTAASLGLQQHDLSSTRPTDRRPDSVTMAATPGQDNERHVTAATFTTTLPQPRPLGGAASALLHVAAPQPASVRVRLWGDGVLLSESTRPASAGAVCPVCPAGSFPAALHFTLPIAAGASASSLTLQVAVTGAGAEVGRAGSVLFGAVSFPSRLTLPAPT